MPRENQVVVYPHEGKKKLGRIFTDQEFGDILSDFDSTSMLAYECVVDLFTGELSIVPWDELTLLGDINEFQIPNITKLTS